MNHNLRVWAGWVGLVGLVLVAAWWLREPLHAMPLERDEGAYAVIAERWLTDGEVLYRDLFDHKPPVIYGVYGLAQLLPLPPVESVRTVATLYVLASGLTVLALGWRLYGDWAALAALAIFLAYASSLRFQGLTFNSEAIMTLPASLACLCAVLALQTGRPWLPGLAGIFVGLAALAKPVGAALVVLPLIASLLLPLPWRRRWLGGVLGLGGTLLAPLLLLIYLNAHDALPAAYEALIGYNRLYAAESVQIILDGHLAWMWRIWEPMLVLALPGLVGLLATLVDRNLRTPAHLITVIWGATLLATALISLRAFPHYYLAAVPAFSLWAGALVVEFAYWLSRRSAPWLASVAGALALLVLLLLPPVYTVLPLRTLSPREQIEALYGYEGVANFWHAADVASYLDDRLSPGQEVFIWAAEPQIYYLADVSPATRFVYDYPVDRLPAARSEVLAALERDPPRYIVTYHSVRPIGFYPFANDHGYELVNTIGGFDLFARLED